MTELKKQDHLTLGFAVMLEVQQRLQEAMGWPSGVRGLQMAKDNLLHTHSEVDEVLGEINWKPHKAHLVDIHGKLKDRTRFVMEITDVFQTLTNVAIAYNVTPEELANALIVKWGVNFEAVADGEVTHAE